MPRPRKRRVSLTAAELGAIRRGEVLSRDGLTLSLRGSSTDWGIRQVARYTRLSLRTIRRYVAADAIPYQRAMSGRLSFEAGLIRRWWKARGWWERKRED